jgi:hypothetical protein
MKIYVYHVLGEPGKEKSIGDRQLLFRAESALVLDNQVQIQIDAEKSGRLFALTPGMNVLLEFDTELNSPVEGEERLTKKYYALMGYKVDTIDVAQLVPISLYIQPLTVDLPSISP